MRQVCYGQVTCGQARNEAGSSQKANSLVGSPKLIMQGAKATSACNGAPGKSHATIRQTEATGTHAKQEQEQPTLPVVLQMEVTTRRQVRSCKSLLCTRLILAFIH